jgi:hypothetical protein
MTVGIIDPALEGRTRPRWNPRWIAYHECGPPFGKEICLHDLHLVRQPETLEILASAHQRARISIGGDYTSDAAPREHGG